MNTDKQQNDQDAPGVESQTPCSTAIDYQYELERLVDVCEQAIENNFKGSAANGVVISAIKYYRKIGIGKQ